MRKLAIIIPVVVLLCLGLSGCKALDEASHYFAGVEDFVRGNRKSTTPAEQKDTQEDTDGDTDDGGDDEHALAAILFKGTADNVSVWTVAEDGTPDDPVLTDRKLDPAGGIRFAEMGDLQDGSYLLEVSDEFDSVDVGFTVAGSDLTLMLVINAEVREMRAVPLPGLIVAEPSP
jgi:hypothetical protein